jgi:endo-1,4-beta-xylanase
MKLLKVGAIFVITFMSVSVVRRQGSEMPVTTTLKDAFKGKFYMGVAINRMQATGKDKAEQELIKQQFNSISPENDLKWQHIHPEDGRYNFGPADAYINMGKQSGMFIVGHTLVWHSQTPDWVFEDESGKPLTREALLARMEGHIKAVAGRYKGVIKGWDVVNEALNEDGSLRDSKWRTIIGDDYIEKAFEFAHEADPDAELYYNDYNLYKAEKRAGAIKIVNNLKAKGIPIRAVGEQGHYNFKNATLQEVEATILDFVKAGVYVNFTELDISVLPDKGAATTADVANNAAYSKELDPYKAGLPKDIEKQLATRYGSIFELFVKYEQHIERITFWGLSDRNTWLNDWPVRGRTNYPLPFNRDLSAKPGVIEAIIKSGR